MKLIKSILIPVLTLLISYLFILLALQACLHIQKSISYGYMQSNCEKLTDKTNSWYECDIK